MSQELVPRGQHGRGELMPSKTLEVGLTHDEREVIINIPASPGVQPQHITFSASQARALARTLMRKADELDGVNRGELTQCDGEDSYE